MQKLVEQHWDYTKHAKFYEFRPNYADSAIDMLVFLVKSNRVTGGGGNIPFLASSRYWRRYGQSQSYVVTKRLQCCCC